MYNFTLQTKEQIIAHLQSGEADMFESAQLMKYLCEEYGLTQGALGKLLGISQSTVGNKIRLLLYSDHERAIIRNYGLTERHARTLLRVSLPQREKLLESAGKLHLSVQQTEDLVEKYKSEADFSSRDDFDAECTPSKDTFLFHVQQGAQRLRNLGFKVTCMVEKGEGWERISVSIRE